MNTNNMASSARVRSIILTSCALLVGTAGPSPQATGQATAQPTAQKAPATQKAPVTQKAATTAQTSLTPLAVGGVTPLRTHYTPSPPNPITEQGWQQEFALVQQGEASQAAGDYASAITAYTQARAMEPADLHVLYHLAECATATGDDADAVNYYRAVVYTDPPPPLLRTFREGNGSKLMPFVLALTKTGQAEEAVSVYDYGVARIDFDAIGGKQAVDVVLPQFGDGPGQLPYTPQGLEAMAHLAIAISTNDMILGAKEAQAAVTLAPDSAAANYYMGKHLLGINDAQAKAYLQKAVELGDDKTAAAAQIYLKCLR